MRRLLPSLPILVSFLSLLCSSPLNAQSPPPSSSPRSLDSLLQRYAYRAIHPTRPITGFPYDAPPPNNFTGIRITALRLRSGSLRKRGVPSYKEFKIPAGVIEQPYVQRLVLVYQNLGNWSSTFYTLPGYTYLAPVLGLLAYDGTNLSATNLAELDVKASRDPISINFTGMKSVPPASTPKCVWFDLHGFPQFSNVVSGNQCSTLQQGHFSIVVQSIAPSPAPVLSPPPPPSALSPTKINSKTWKIVAFVVGGFLLLLFLGFLILSAHRYKRRKQMQHMEKAAEVGESLHMTSIGNTRAPVAMGTRTQPVLENEYVP